MEGKQSIFQKGHLYLEDTSRLINDKYVFN